MTAEHTPADETNGLAAVGENIVYGVQSTNNGNVDVEGVAMLDTVGGLRANGILHICSAKQEQKMWRGCLSQCLCLYTTIRSNGLGND